MRREEQGFELAGIVDRIIALLGAFNGRVMPVLVNIAAVLIVLMTVAVVAGVFFRYVLNNSLPFVEEVAIVAAIWVAFLVAPFAYRTGGHVAIELIIQSLPGILTRALRILLNLLILWLLYRFFIEAITFVKNGNFQKANTLPIKTSWLRSIVPFSIAMLILVGVELILRDALALFTGRRDVDLPHIQPVEPE